ncbi:MAG: MOSC domain-containing protein [Phycisphaerales bacterium]|nr:MOSC domain-containing protein [Phycisphaerales bacterium]
MGETHVGYVQGIAIRQGKNGPMRELHSVRASAGGGLDGDNDATRARAITFISSRQWAQVQRELDAEIPWHTRRANILIDAETLAPLMGKTVQVGGVRVKINAETRPCELMDQLHPGLQAALKPECRAGVYGSILHDGTIAVGDAMVEVD